MSATMDRVFRNRSTIQAALPSFINLGEVIASGGQGIVFGGTVNGYNAAIKIYLPGQITKRIEREISALQILNCPNIVRLLWSGDIEVADIQVTVVATHFVPGETLKAKLEKNKKLNFADAARMAVDVANAINHMWQSRIVHRDLKPTNLILSSKGDTVVIDLGLARHLEHSSLTVLGATWGTLGYLSPEQTRAARQLTCKSDIFALGVVVLESLLGRHPTSGDQLRLITAGFHEQLPPSIESWKHAAFLKTMLHTAPTRRPLPVNIVEYFSNKN